MDHQTSAIIFTNFYVLYFAARVYWAGKAGKRPVQKNKSFFLDRLNIGLVGIFTMIVPLLAVYTHWLDQFDYLENSTLIFLSIPFLLGGLIVFWKSHQDLAENWSVTLELKENHTLITNGIFKYVRHPMYLAFWLSVIGQALCIPNYIGGFGGIVAWAILYFVRIGKEEQMMVEKFGDEYRNYMARTKRLVPYLF